jgi:intracellular multiplication protein IcmK
MRKFLSAIIIGVAFTPIAVYAQTPPGNQTAGPVLPPETARIDTLPPSEKNYIRNAIPLTPTMIEELNQRYGDNKRATETSQQADATPGSRLIRTSFAPGQITSIIQTVHGYPTAVSFFDSTGQPWPISWNTNSNSADVDGGTNCNSSGSSKSGSPSVNAVGFYVCVPTPGSNTIEITPMSQAPRGGLVVSLQDAPKPLSFLLISGKGHYDADLSVHVADRGPHAKDNVDFRSGAPVTGAPYMNAMLAGIPPADAQPLSVTGVSPDDVRAWRIGGETFIRTRYTLMSPAWDVSESGEGGTTLYAIPNTPVVLLSADSHTISAELGEKN